MEFNIIARRFALTQSIADYAQKKVTATVSKIRPAATKVHVILAVEKKYLHTVEIVVQSPHGKFLSKSHSEDLYAAIDLACGKLSKQLKKYKEKMKDHHRRPAIRDLAPAAVSVFERGTNEIAETKSFDIRELTPDAAVEKMLDSEYNFYVFKNSESGSVSIVYKRSDGTFGMIELNI
ncbi:MAG: ribosomal subunit interface protein [Elusimicrobia bacterium HGW-Elusimicrobia-1]|jgi:ribosomal subunit interface protein|nr:MAG: ribosomal subunit interface protein [Elusimicrobia bacterium HGW-Elusimicrobia-1]